MPHRTHPRPFPLSWLAVLGLLALLVFQFGIGARAAAPGTFVWLEGEAPASIAPEKLSVKRDGWGRKEFLSGEKWLQVSIDANNVERETPADGVLLTYPFTMAAGGKYEVWDRVGYEFVRSPFDWRIDGGAWHSTTPNDLTTDLMELEQWNEVAWLKLGDQQLAAGAHRLEIRLPRTKDEKGKTARILYASDAILLYPGEFHPNGRFKPGEEYRTAQDQEAGKKVFELPDAAPPAGGAAARVTLPLKGLWEVCRHDEQLPGEVAAPMNGFPAEPHWKSIPVPGDKNTLRPDLVFAHRLWYRTRVRVPERYAGRSFQLVFPLNNLNTTVWVNGAYCGFNKNPYARFRIDVTKAVRPGMNEVWVGIRDAWYGYSANPKDPMKLRRKFNLPLSFSHQGFQDLAYPIWSAFRSGILYTPEFVVGGPVYTADAFCKPSVARKELAVEVTLANPTAKPLAGEVTCEAVDPASGTVAAALPSRPFSLAPAGEQVVQVSGPWSNPKLWWPDEPNQYTLRTRVKLDGKVVDLSDTSFGFREWTAEGKEFRLNGLPWHGWAELTAGKSKEEWLANYRKTNQRFMRLMGAAQGGIEWQGLTTDEALEFFDRNGVVVRRSGPLDGEAIGYMAVEQDPELKKKYGSEIKMELMENWRDQMVAQVKGERNHPSVMLWSVENEWLYINCINLYGGLMDPFEAEVKKTCDAVQAVDPTRLTMADGGGAGKAQLLPVHGDHYVFRENDTRYPDLAYQPNPDGGGRGRWTWDQKRPRYLGEEFFANGINPADYAMLGGEAAFQGKVQAKPAAGRIYRMLTEGYRWAEYGAWHFWLGPESASDQYGANAPLAVFCRQWDWTFASGQKVSRTFGIFNDTRFDDPVTFAWSLVLNGKKLAGASSVHKIPAGKNEKFERTLTLPKVVSRQEAQLVLTLSRGGKEVFRDAKPLSILTGPFTLEPGKTVVLNVGGKNPAPALQPLLLARAGTPLLVYDPSGAVVEFLTRSSMPFTRLADLKTLPEKGKVLLIGKDALDLQESTSSRLAAWASAGRSVIVLEQRNPLKYQGLPAEMEPSAAGGRDSAGTMPEGRIAWAEDLGHPALRGLQQKDFYTWGPDSVVYRLPYVKPARGAKSLVQCGPRLGETVLAEVPAGQGLILVSQLAVEEKLSQNAVSQKLLANLIDYAANYRLEHRPVAVVTRENPQLPKVLDSIGLQYHPVEDPLKALAEPATRLVIMEATPANLKLGAANRAVVEKFNARGGYLVLHGLTPEGLADYNTLVGWNHMIRPFRMERVTFPASKHPLTSGLTLGDIVMQSGKRINNFTSDTYLASDIFSYVVDYDEVASFAKLPEPSYFGNKDAENDHNPWNMVNGFVSADGWQLIFSIWAGGGVPTHFPLVFPQEQTLTELEWTGNAFYYPTRKVELTFDGKKESTVAFETEPNNQTQTFSINPPRTGKELTLRIAAWEKVGNTPIVGIDNLRLKAQRPPAFYKQVRPMLNIGGLMEYPRGTGGIVLCNLLFQEQEAVPLNAVKKRTLLSTVLRNLKAPFTTGSAVIAGSRLRYEPIDLSKYATQYRDDKGWFGDKAFTFAALPTGKQTFAGVPYQVYDFPTSPVPTALMLKGPGIPGTLPDAIRGIPVNRKADALFFLHSARIDRRRNEREVREKKSYDLARYVVTYADGQTVEIPIRSEIDVEEYRQKSPTPIPGAQIAWTRPYEGTEWNAVAYSKQWDNPRPDVEIKSVDLVYGQERRGVPVLLALTAAAVAR